MTLAFQLAVFALIATSLILLISVPVVFASPDGWSSNKNVVFSGTSLWIGLVFLVGILNSLISWTYSSQTQNQNDPPNFSRLWDTLNWNLSPPKKRKSNKENKKIRGGSNFLNKKNTIKKIIGIVPKRICVPALHKKDPVIYHICGYILCIKNKKMRIWSNGKISLCQGEDAGSIPAIRPRSKIK